MTGGCIMSFLLELNLQAKICAEILKT